jgi:uncharacterized membrane protein
MTSTAAPKASHAPILRPAKLLKIKDPKAVHPTVLAEAQKRAASVQLRVADAITSFAGSMWFVYVHIVLFAVWMVFGEKNPWPTLTLVVSLEAIFLSTFVMIGQNRQAEFQQAKADRDYTEQEQLLVENTDITRKINDLSAQIHELSQQIHDVVVARGDLIAQAVHETQAEQAKAAQAPHGGGSAPAAGA